MHPARQRQVGEDVEVDGASDFPSVLHCNGTTLHVPFQRSASCEACAGSSSSSELPSCINWDLSASADVRGKERYHRVVFGNYFFLQIYDREE